MDELSFYNGAHTGEEIDIAVDYANRDGLVKVTVDGLTSYNMDQSRYCDVTVDIPTGDNIPVITASHNVLWLYASRPEAIMSDIVIHVCPNTTNTIRIVVTIRGATELTMFLGKAPNNGISFFVTP